MCLTPENEVVVPVSTDGIDPDTTPTIRPAKMGLYPTMESLQSVVDLANSQLPIKDQNVMLGLLMTYHNTLLHNLELETNYVPRKP